MKLIAKTMLLALLCLPAAAFAELPPRVADDFKAIEGYVVMPVGDEYIVDLDEKSGLHVGDILTLLTPGKKILHPVTGQVMGSMDEPAGFLAVTRLFSGYSYAKLLSPGVTPANGAKVRRFEQVPALFDDQAGDGGVLARQIRQDLPQFAWLAAGAAEKALLRFTLRADGFEVASTDGVVLHRYEVTAEQQIVSTEPEALRPLTVARGPEVNPLQKLTNSVLGTLNLADQDRFAEMDAAIIRQKKTAQRGIWMSPGIEGTPIGVAVADLDGDGKQEIATLLEDRLLVSRIADGVYAKVAELPLPPRRQLLGVDALDLNGDGRSELYVSALSGFRPASFVIELRGAEYAVIIDHVHWFLRGMDFGKGRVLVGQRMGNEEKQTFSGSVFTILRQGDDLVEGEALELPRQVNLFNALAFTDRQGQAGYAYLTTGDYLKVIAADGTDRWESADYYGGSENCFTNRPAPRDDIVEQICMNPRMVTGPGNLLIVAQNEGQRMVQRYRKFSKSQLVALSWNGFAMEERWRTASQGGYLADFAYADADNDGAVELVQAIQFQRKGLTDEARSSLAVYELD